LRWVRFSLLLVVPFGAGWLGLKNDSGDSSLVLLNAPAER